MSIILIRHGETALNVGRVLQPANTPLSERGQAQARAVAQRLAGMGLAGIVSSDLPRAWATAQAIASATGLPVQATALLHERNFGELRGVAYDGLDFDPLTMDAAPPGGESMAVFWQRVAQAWTHVLGLRQALGGPLAVVTHGLVIGALLERHLHVALAGAQVANTSLCIVSAQPPQHVELLACTRHLETDAA